jgi:putative hydrolase of the HAD superfamily
MTHDSSLYRGVLFDFYDTLAFLNPAVVEAGRVELARRAGVGMEELAPIWRATSRERMLGTAGDMAAQLRFMFGQLGLEAEERLIEELAEFEHDVWRRAVQLYPDTKPTLAELRRRGFKLGILSNCSCQAGAVIHHLGLSDLVDAVILSFEVGLAKPDPAIYRAACGALDLEPSECVFVADGAGGELEAARGLGMLAVKIYRVGGRHPEDTSVVADRRVESLKEGLALIDSQPRDEHAS